MINEKNKIRILHIINITIITFLCSFVVFFYNSKEIANAQASPPVLSEVAPNFFQCMLDAMSAYAGVLIDAKANGTLPANVKLLSPAFNGTSYTLGEIAGGMSSVYNSPHIEGVAMNIYHTPGGSMTQNANTQNMTSLFGNKPIIITEAGCASDVPDKTNCHAQLPQEIQEFINNSGLNVQSLNLFNPTGSNPGFPQHNLTPEQLQAIVNANPGLIGINYGNPFGFLGPLNNNYGTSSTVQIAESGNYANTLATIQNSGTTVIIRIGVGDSSGGFDKAADYVGYLANLAKAAPDKTFYAIAGPNEPDLEHWMFQECALLFPNEFLLFRKICGGQVDMEYAFYLGDVIGHSQTSKPFNIKAAVKDKQDDTDDVDDLASYLSASMSITMKIDHPDFQQVASQTFGSIDPTSEHYIKNRIDEDLPLKVNFPQINFAMPDETKIPASQGIQLQDKRKPKEDYEEYTKRLWGTTVRVKDQKTILGMDSDFRAVQFNACIQKVGCDPNTDQDPESGLLCIRKDKLMTPGAPPSSYLCGPGDDLNDCVTTGRVFPFVGNVVYEEPPALQTIARGEEVFMRQSIVEMPGYTAVTAHTLAQGFGTLANQQAKERELAQEYQKSIDPNYAYNKQNPNEIQKAYAQAIPKALAQIGPPTEAEDTQQRVNDGTYQTTTPAGCSGMTLLIEEKGSSFAVKAWDTRPSHCALLYDYAWHAEYFIDGRKIAECSSPIQSNAMPRYPEPGDRCLQPENQNDPSCRRRLDGLSVGDQCPIPATPNDGELTVRYSITHSNAPYDPVCGQTAFCGCSGDSCSIEGAPAPPVDCRVCNSWAPDALCRNIIASEMIVEDQCVDGSCTATDIQIEKDFFDKAKDWVPFDLNGWAWIQSYFTSLIQGWIGVDCVTERGPEDPATGQRDESIKCSFNAKNYNVYMYQREPFIGDFGEGPGNHSHMELNDALFNFPGVTDQYFIPKSVKAPVTVTLDITEFDTDKDDIPHLNKYETGFIDTAENPDDFSRDKFAFVGLADLNDNTRILNVEYTKFEQPITSGYCLSQRFLVNEIDDDKKVPASVASSRICNNMDFMPGALPKPRAAAESEKTEATNILETNSNNIALNIGDSLLVSKTAENIEKLMKNAQDNGISVQEQSQINAALEKYLETISPEEFKTLKKEMLNDLEVILKKNNFDLSVGPENYPENVKRDLDAMNTKYRLKVLARIGG